MVPKKTKGKSAHQTFSQFIQNEKCSAGEYCHCDEITRSKHLDILEMDAASRTGIDDVRELIDSSKYNPTRAKYKIFIIDEYI